MSAVRKAAISAITAELNEIDKRRESLIKERRKLDLEQRKEDHPCPCVKLNADIEVYDMQEQERRGRNPLGLGLVSECLTARKDCISCNGTGKPAPIHHTCETFNPDTCAACRVIQRNID